MGAGPSVAENASSAAESPRKRQSILFRESKKAKALREKEELEERLVQEQLEKQKTAVGHVHNHIYAYMPVTTEQVRYPRESPKFGSSYIWVCPERAELEKATLEAARMESVSPMAKGSDGSKRKASIVSNRNPFAGCPDGVMCDEDGNICVVRGHEHVEISHETLIASVQLPSAPSPPLVGETTPSSIGVKWSGPPGWVGIIERFEAQYRLHGAHGQELEPEKMRWRSLSVSDARTTTLTEQPHNTYYSFRVRCQGVAGWSEYSLPTWPERTSPQGPSRPPLPVQGGTDLGGSGTGPCHITVRMRRPADDGGEPLTTWELRWLKVVIEAVDSDASSDDGDAEGAEKKEDGAPPSPKAKPKLLEEWETIYSGNAPPDLEAKVDGLAAGFTHRFQSRVMNNVGWSQWSQSVDLHTQRPPILKLTTALGNWVQAWDDALGMWAYTNQLTGETVTKKPPAFAALERALKAEQEAQRKRLAKSIGELGGSGAGGEGGDGSPMSAKTFIGPPWLNPQFRQKRFRFLHKLQQDTGRRRTVGGVEVLTSGGAAIELRIRRTHMLADTITALGRLSKSQLRRKMKIHYAGENGIDEGGLTADWFAFASKAFFEKQNKPPMFQRLDGGLGYSIRPVPLSFDEEKKEALLENFTQFGRFVGKALLERGLMELRLATVVYEQLLGTTLDITHLAKLEPALAKSLRWMLKNDISNIIFETFSVDVEKPSDDPDAAAVMETLDLKMNGRNIDVTEKNKAEYVNLIVGWRCQHAVAEPLGAIKEGLHSIVSEELLRTFTYDELQLVLCGRPSIDLVEIRHSTVYENGLSEGQPVIKWFWAMLKDMTPEECSLFLTFVTGAPRIPLDGLDPPLKITGNNSPAESLPRSHTCFNQIELPDYTSANQMELKVRLAITESKGFAFS